MAVHEAPNSIDVTVNIFFFTYRLETIRLCVLIGFFFLHHCININLFQDIQFKLHSKYQLFHVNASTPNYNGIDLLAAASTYGLVVVGKPSSCEIQGLLFWYFTPFDLCLFANQQLDRFCWFFFCSTKNTILHISDVIEFLIKI